MSVSWAQGSNRRHRQQCQGGPGPGAPWRCQQCQCLTWARLWLLSTEAAAAGLGDGAGAAHSLSPLSWEWVLGGKGALRIHPEHSSEWAAQALDRSPVCGQCCHFSFYPSLALSCHASPGGRGWVTGGSRGARPTALPHGLPSLSPLAFLEWWQWQGAFAPWNTSWIWLVHGLLKLLVFHLSWANKKSLLESSKTHLIQYFSCSLNLTVPLILTVGWIIFVLLL